MYTRKRFEGVRLNRVAVVRFLLIALFTVLGFSLAFARVAQAYEESERELPDLEDLIHFEVTSVSKKAENMDEAAAAIYVITSEDIRRSGVRSIPEALRMAPGIDVAQLSGNTWSVSSRGMNNEFADSLLVLIDGRSVYTPLFGGVYWDVQDTLLDNIDRIEVIRGPGGTMWGSSAVTGVINIVTKDASKTQGGYLQAGAGNLMSGFGGMRYGGKVGEDLSYRVYGKTDNYDSMDRRFSSEPRAEDTHRLAMGGWRVDWDASARDRLTFQGDYYQGRINNLRPTTAMVGSTLALTYPETREDASGANVILNWSRTISQDQDVSLKFYYDHTARDNNSTGAKQKNDIWDLEFQHHRPFFFGSDILWGLSYRQNVSNYNATGINPLTGYPGSPFFEHSRRVDNLYSGFAQVDMPFLSDDSLHLILGSKLERNDYTGWEVQPTFRFTWAPAEKQLFWGAISRAIITPSRIQEEGFVAFLQPGNPVAVVAGNSRMDAQTQESVEFGYRIQPLHHLHLDVTAFYNVIKDRFSVDLGNFSPLPQPHVNLPFKNIENIHSRGVELTLLWQVLENWQLHTNYSYLHIRGNSSANPAVANKFPNTSRSTPAHQVTVRSIVDLPFHLQFDTSMYYVRHRDYVNPVAPNVGETISGYTRFDFRLGWEPTENLEFSAALLNAFQRTHSEQFSTGQQQVPTDVRRSYYGSVTWRF